MDEVKTFLRANYHLLCRVFHFYSALEGSPFIMTLNKFSHFTKDTLIRNEQSSGTKEAHCDTIFIKVKSSYTENLTPAQKLLNRKCKTFKLKKGHSIMRFEFLESIIRLAVAKFANSKGQTQMLEAVKMLVRVNIKERLGKEMILNPDNFRRDRMYTQKIDETFSPYKAELQALFNRYAGMGVDSEYHGGSPGRRMTFDEWRRLCVQSGLLTPFFTMREAALCFVWSNLTISDQIQNWQSSVTLTFTSFLEGICRLSDVIFVPTEEQRELCGVDSIEEFYHLMESTGLWDTFTVSRGCKCSTNLGIWSKSSHFSYNDEPLHQRLDQVLKLLFST